MRAALHALLVQTLNEEKAIAGCIQALREAIAGEGQVEVIVADGGSTDRWVGERVSEQMPAGMNWLPRGASWYCNLYIICEPVCL